MILKDMSGEIHVYKVKDFFIGPKFEGEGDSFYIAAATKDHTTRLSVESPLCLHQRPYSNRTSRIYEQSRFGQAIKTLEKRYNLLNLNFSIPDDLPQREESVHTSEGEEKIVRVIRRIPFTPEEIEFFSSRRNDSLVHEVKR